MAELYIVDADFKKVESDYYSEAQLVDEQVEKYITTVTSIVNDKIIEGDSGQALLDFAETAKSFLTGEFSSILERHNDKTRCFVNDTESDDDASFV